jgi:digeranylgeranylglycerophospholipid reductase
MKYNYDVIVAGAGVAGVIISKILAEGGFKVALVEMKKQSAIGSPWEITVEKRIFERVCLKAPDDKDMPENPDYYRFYSHDNNNYLEMKAENDAVYYLHHHRFNQWLLETALARGVHFLDRFRVTECIVHDTQVCGIRGERETPFFKRKMKLTGKIIVDATGTNRALCTQVPGSFLIPPVIREEDWVSAWQEVRRIPTRHLIECERKLNISPGIAYVRIGKYHAYQVIFYRKNNTLNLVFSAALGETIPSARTQCDSFVSTCGFLKKRLYGGGKNLIIRRSIDTMVGNGFLCLGDAACQIVPTTGSGIASAMYAADIASKAIARAVNEEDYTINTLWDYNYYYQSKRGAILASYDIIRLFMQSLTYDEIKSIFNSHFLKDSNFIDLYSSNKFVYNIQQIFELFSRLISNVELIPIGMQMVQTIRDSQRILRLYQNYPSVYNKERFLSWKQQVNSVFSRYYAGLREKGGKRGQKAEVQKPGKRELDEEEADKKSIRDHQTRNNQEEEDKGGNIINGREEKDQKLKDRKQGKKKQEGRSRRPERERKE